MEEINKMKLKIIKLERLLDKLEFSLNELQTIIERTKK